MTKHKGTKLIYCSYELKNVSTGVDSAKLVIAAISAWPSCSRLESLETAKRTQVKDTEAKFDSAVTPLLRFR
ncbi:hypothetical protein ACROYT_G002676 [Oculina patagonica]